VKELEPHIKITLAAGLGTLADLTTTKIGLKYPELQEMNPMFSPLKEFCIASLGGEVIYGLGQLLKQSEEVSLVMGLMPSMMSFGVAVNNLAWITYAHRKYYPWKECPILYPEGE